MRTQVIWSISRPPCTGRLPKARSGSSGGQLDNREAFDRPPIYQQSMIDLGSGMHCGGSVPAGRRGREGRKNRRHGRMYEGREGEGGREGDMAGKRLYDARTKNGREKTEVKKIRPVQ